MTEKDLFDAQMKLADYHSQKVYNRQQYQWRVTIGLWTVLLATGAFLYGKNLGALARQILCGSSAVVFFVYTFVWVRAVAIRNFDDQAAARKFSEAAEKRTWITKNRPTRLLAENKETLYERLRRHRVCLWWFHWFFVWAHLFEVVTTALILVLMCYVIVASPPTPPDRATFGGPITIMDK